MPSIVSDKPFTEPVVAGILARTHVPKGAKDIIVFDPGAPGFLLRLYASGTAVYGVQVKVLGKSRRHALGPASKGRLKDAHKLAGDIIAKARLGQDVMAEKRAAAAKVETPLSDVIDKYLAARKWSPQRSDAENVNDRRLRPRTWEEAKRYLEGGYFKPLRSKAVDEIGRREIVAQVSAIEDASGKRTADCARAHLGMCFAWAVDRYGLLANPVLGIKARGKTVRRSRTLSPGEIREVWDASFTAGPQGGGEFGRIVRLLLLTGQRRDEIANLAWQELNTDEARVELPPERTKNHLPHVVPLSDQAAEVLAGVERVAGDAFVFGRGEVAGFQGWSRAKRALDGRVAKARKKAGIQEEMPRWTLHDLRRTAASGMAGLKIEPAVIEAVLNHVSGVKAGVAGTYNHHYYLDEKREALKSWGAHVANIVGA